MSISLPWCRFCATTFDMQDEWRKSDVIACPACGQEHEVIERTDDGVHLELTD